MEKKIRSLCLCSAREGAAFQCCSECRTCGNFLCQAVCGGRPGCRFFFFFSVGEKTADVLCKVISKFSSTDGGGAVFFGGKIAIEQNSWYTVVSKFKYFIPI